MTPSLIFYINPQTKICYTSLFGHEQLKVPDPVRGEQWDLGIVLVDELQMTASDGRIWKPRDLTDYTVRVFVGTRTRMSFQDGHYTVTVGANTTADLGFNANAAAVSVALNALASLIAAGGVTVAASSLGFFVTFVTNGVRALAWSGDGTELIPNGLVGVFRRVTGDADTQEVWEIWLETLAPVRATLTDDFDAASVSVDVLQVGDATHDHQVRVALTGAFYSGSIQLIIGGVTSGIIAYNSASDAITAILEAMTSVGADNVEATQEEVGVWLIHFIGTKSLTDMGAITFNATGLVTLPGKVGELDFTDVQLKNLLGTDESIGLVLEVETRPVADQRPFKSFSTDLKLWESVNDPEDGTDSGMDPTVTGINYRVSGGVLQLKNTTTGLWHTFGVSGAGGSETFDLTTPGVA